MYLFSRDTLCILFFFFLAHVTIAQLQGVFIPNKTQWDNNILYMTEVKGSKMILEKGRFQYVLHDYKALEKIHLKSHEPDRGADPSSEGSIKSYLINVNFVGANKNAIVDGISITDHYYNFFLGEESQWATGIYGYEGVYYHEFYKGIDLKVYYLSGNLKYDFIAEPGADLSQIVIEYEGMDELLLEQGDLICKTSLGSIIEKNPVSYQYKGGVKKYVDCNFKLNKNRLSFEFPGGYDSCSSLTIDPLLIFSTFSGSTADNWGSTATPGENGTLYSAGVTKSDFDTEKFPATPGAFQTSNAGFYDIGILKYDSLGKKLIYATYLGGSGGESAHSLIVNKDEELLVLGTTSSSDFPTTTFAFDRSFNGGPPVSPLEITYTFGCDIFITKFNKEGSTLSGSTFVGGSHNDGINELSSLVANYGDVFRGDIITDQQGNVYVSSVTSSEDFPVKNAFDLSFNGGGTDALIFKMSPDLSQLLWATFLGGTGVDASHSIKIDRDNVIYVAGGTTSFDFPVKTNAFQSVLKGDTEGWISKLSNDGLDLIASTFTGTSDFDQVYFIDLNAAEEIYAFGQTDGDFLVTPGVYTNPNSGQFLQKFNNDLTQVIFSTVFGSGIGIPDISPTAFLVNDCNNIYMTGWGGGINSGHGFWSSSTIGLPVTSDAFQSTTSGNDFYFIVLADDGSELLYATYLGGNKTLTHVDGGTSRFDKGGIVYHSVCAGCDVDQLGPKSDFPTTEGAWSRTNNSTNCNNAAFKFDLTSLRSRIQTNTIDFKNPGIQFICIPDEVIFQNKGIGGEEFYWDFGDGTRLFKTDSSFVKHRYQSAGLYTIKLKIIDKGTCKVVDSTSVKLKVFQSEFSVQDDDDLCEGTSYELKASGAVTYQWSAIDGNFTSGAAHPVVSPVDTTEYMITLIDKNGCIRNDTVTINVIPKINPVFTFTRGDGCLKNPALHLQNRTDSLQADDIVFFNLGDGTTSENDITIHEYKEEGVYPVTLTTLRHGCLYETQEIIPMRPLFVPNVITPGLTDGNNDKLVIVFGKKSDNIVISTSDAGFKTSLSIFNRWGHEIFKDDDYTGNWSGNDVEPATYFIHVTVEGYPTCKSWIQVVK